MSIDNFVMSQVWLRSIAKDLAGEIAANHFMELRISARHALAAGSLPSHHSDPFDRMLIARARLEVLTIVTHDQRFGAYEIPVLWT
jgi:PIN domain nuclease of toxin-antitoxin system